MRVPYKNFMKSNTKKGVCDCRGTSSCLSSSTFFRLLFHFINSFKSAVPKRNQIKSEIIVPKNAREKTIPNDHNP